MRDLEGPGFFLRKVTSGLSSWMFEILEGTWILLSGVGRLLWLLGLGWSFTGYSSFFVLPLDFYGRLRAIWTVFIPGALGIEASFLADTGSRQLRTAIFRAVWSGRQPLANTGAVPSLLDGPSGCDPAFCVVWLRFRMLCSYLACRYGEVHRLYRLTDGAAAGCPGHGPAHLLVLSAAEIGFQLDSCQLGWERLGLLVRSNPA